MALIDALLLDPYPLAVWMAARTDGQKGSGRASDPYDGSNEARFDAVMAQFQSGSNVTIYLGPGIFKTTGWNASAASGLGAGAWQARPGMKIVGSGMDVTTLLLVNVGTAAEHYYAIGHPLGSATKADLFEVRDLTVNCGLPASGSAACGAVQLLGSHVRVTRVKATNWGTRSSASSDACFVFALLSAYPAGGVAETVNSGMEDCVAIAPSPNHHSAGLVTVFHVGSREALALTATGEGSARSPFIRNSLVDCQLLEPPTAFTPNMTTPRYRALSMGWCRGGLVEGNDVRNADIGGPYPHQDSRSARDVVVRNNFYWNVGRGPYFKLGGLGSSLGGGTLVLAGNEATISGTSLAGLAVGDRVKIVSNPTTFSGVYVITFLDGSSFKVITPSPPSAVPTISSVQKVFGLGRVVIEGNVIELGNSLLPGGANGVALEVDDANGSNPYPEAPDYVHGDVFIRNNKLRYVDSAAPARQGDLGTVVNGAKNLAISNNIIESRNTSPTQNRRCGSVKYFNNKTPSGALTRGLNGDTNSKYDELETDAEDAFVLAMFSRRR